MRRAVVTRRPLFTPFSRTCLSLVPYRMTSNSVKSIGHVTHLAKLDLIGPTQARDNERHRVEVSRSLICGCTNMVIIRVNLNLFISERSGYSDRYLLPKHAKWISVATRFQSPQERCTSTLFRPPSATTFITSRTPLPSKHTWHDCLGRKPPSSSLLVRWPTN